MNGNIRLALLIDTIESPTAGTERQLLMLLEGLDRRRFDPLLCVLRSSPWLERDFRLCPLHVLGIRSFYSPDSWRKVWGFSRFLRENHVDLVHVHFRDASIAGVLAARLAGVRAVVAARKNQGYWLTPSELRLQRLLNRGITLFVANSEDTRGWVARTERVEAGRIRVIHNGLDLPRFMSTNGSREHLREELAILGSSPAVGIVANLRPVKRVDLFLKMAAEVCREIPEAVFVVVGDGPERRGLEALARDLGIEGSVRFLGRRLDVPEVLSALDLGVLCSESESFSNSVIEYMACGLPVVCTDVGGCREALGRDGAGLIVPKNDIRALARGVVDIVRNEVVRARARRESPIRAGALFSRDRYVAAFEHLYGELAGEASCEAC